MLRILGSVIRVGVERVIAPNITNLTNIPPCKLSPVVNSICTRAISFGTLQSIGFGDKTIGKSRTLLSSPLTPSVLPVIQQPTTISKRQLTKFSYRKGKRKTVHAVTDRFFRLHWGIWIRTKCGRNSNLWRKSINRKKRIARHVFCNATQSYLLDKMVTKFWKRPKYYVDDPYEPYHTRENFFLSRMKPVP